MNLQTTMFVLFLLASPVPNVDSTDCASLDSSLCNDKYYADSMRKNCPSACSAPAGACEDKSGANCAQWKANGFCEDPWKFYVNGKIGEYCKKTCQKC